MSRDGHVPGTAVSKVSKSTPSDRRKLVPYFRDNRQRMQTPIAVTRLRLHSPIASLLTPSTANSDDHNGYRLTMAQTASSHGFKMGTSVSSPQLRAPSRPETTNSLSRRDPFEMPLKERLLETTRLPSRERMEAVKKLEILALDVVPQKIFDTKPVNSAFGLGVASEDHGSDDVLDDRPNSEQAIAPIWLEKWLALQQSFPEKPVAQADNSEIRASSSGAHPQKQRRREVHNAFDYKKPQRKFLFGITVPREPIGQRITDQQTWSKPGVQAFWTLNHFGPPKQPSPRRKGDWAYQSCSDFSRKSD